MPFRVDFLTGIANVPLAVERRARATLQEVAATLEAIPADASFWDTPEDLTLDIGRWRFTYRVDRGTSSLFVTKVTSTLQQAG
jgi:hypothetical protein